MLREDYIIRLIKQLADAIARIAGLRQRGDYVRAQQEVDRAWAEVLDLPRELVDATDPATLASLLREPDKMRVAAQLLAEEARVMIARGDPLNASVLRARARELYVEARTRDPRDDDDNAILELSRE
jgi:hypothetical protein